jgi:hypothetical protein
LVPLAETMFAWQAVQQAQIFMGPSPVHEISAATASAALPPPPPPPMMPGAYVYPVGGPMMYQSPVARPPPQREQHVWASAFLWARDGRA